MQQLITDLESFIANEVQKAGRTGIVLGLSGGIDSAVTAVLCKRVFPDTTLGLIMPCQSDNSDQELAYSLASRFSIPVQFVDLSEIFANFNRLLSGAPKNTGSPVVSLAAANLKVRLRMITLYYFANSLNRLVAGTGNKSEILTGYFTKYGDGGADFFPLGGLLKSEVINLARVLEIPEAIISRPPSAGLWKGQTDEDELGITYRDLDRAIRCIEENKWDSSFDPVVTRVKKMISSSAHKRRMPPIFQPEPRYRPPDLTADERSVG